MAKAPVAESTGALCCETHKFRLHSYSDCTIM